MTLEELMDEACTIAGLPGVARLQLPNSLSSETKLKSFICVLDEVTYEKQSD